MSNYTPVGLGDEAATVKALTHSGNFHVDETLGYVILHYALAPHGDLRGRVLGTAPADRLDFGRTRSPERIRAADIVFDVGGIYDPQKGRYDHHMKDKPLREDGVPYSAAGLLWKDYGIAAIRNILKAPVDEAALPLIWQSIDRSLVLPIDQDDNGVVKLEKLSLADIVSSCRPAWDTAELYGPDEAKMQESIGFADAATTVAAFLVNTVDRVRASLKATDRVLAAYEAAQDKRILVMDTGMPTEKVIFEHDLPVVYVVSPAAPGRWNVKAVPPVRGDFGQRVSLPEAWRGLDGEALAKVSGVEDAVFAHPARFICGAGSKEGALKMARLALEIDETLNKGA
ncbi:MYG1 family protein [Gluconacetobacter entanii]|uniref:MYG1 family protein n=1 Tax=Gluconacetobacter entanii TaxID=108528 RepID=UPI001C9361E6|nr:MYG1 family protein [Gluconacetobacter entanii]MBY4639299.1 MYG1 family protein [Gluconacetobacter entanii]MCW4580410.1 MYG1 family protein [Gluconacetobacter entanii]MCW4583743.1 MYG1 family protein [Gluconacetobacter entanii]MCW4587090.1 MYG1 family protein [Gluconacetobacter entanii]